MNTPYTLDFYLAAGQYELAADVYRDLIDVSICGTSLSTGNPTRDEYSIFAYNQKGLERILYNTRGDFRRFFIVYRQVGQEPLVRFLRWILAKCDQAGNVYDEFEKYAQMSLEDLYWCPSQTYDEVFPENTPTLSWRFERGYPPTSEDAVFDERIIIDLSWNFEDKIITFRGYWYVISTGFLEQRVEEIDPYYRRFAFICHLYDKARLQECIDEFYQKFSRVIPKNRGIFLRYYFEIDPEQNIYKR